MKQQWWTAGLAWLVYQGSGVHMIKYQTKFHKVKLIGHVKFTDG